MTKYLTVLDNSRNYQIRKEMGILKYMNYDETMIFMHMFRGRTRNRKGAKYIKIATHRAPKSKFTCGLGAESTGKKYPPLLAL